jgi:hypothetical protein
LIHRARNTFVFLWEMLFRGGRSHVNGQPKDLTAVGLRGELTHLYDTTSGRVTERKGASLWKRGTFPLGIAIACSCTGKALWAPHESLSQILHSPRENAHSDRYQPQDVVFIWLLLGEG